MLPGVVAEASDQAEFATPLNWVDALPLEGDFTVAGDRASLKAAEKLGMERCGGQGERRWSTLGGEHLIIFDQYLHLHTFTFNKVEVF